MPRIRRIPEQYLTGIKYLLSINEEAFQELLVELRNAPPVLFNADYFDRLTPDKTLIAREQTIEIIDTISSMSMTRVVNNVSIPEFIKDITDALEQGRAKSITLTPETRQQFIERVTALLNLDIFKVGAKATNILFEHEHTLSKARILTDVRPVFGDDVNMPPIGVVIVHTLKIEYREGDEYKEFFVAMDTRDPQILIDVLERAKLKAEGLKSVLSVAQIYPIDFD